jgi:hypothetical protein
MKTPPFFRCVLAALVCFAALALSSLALDQPHMRNTIDLLQDAKKSAHPLPLLEAAHHQLATAKHDKGGERKEALPILKEAIAEARAGDHQKMVEKIDHVIAKVHAGIFKGKNN